MMSFNSDDMYKMGYDTNHPLEGTMNNRLFCTFTKINELDDLIETITSSYTILYNKIFVLYSKDSEEYLVTYNVEQENLSNILNNTILVHRKKEFNVLYSMNGLNEIIKKLKGGYIDTSYELDWSKYKNSILLTQKGEFKQLETKIHKIITL